jgi:hypothetical protein
MAEVSIDQMKQAVESQHGGKASFVQSVPVTERRLWSDLDRFSAAAW